MSGAGSSSTPLPDRTKPDFPLVKIPLQQACDILRQFFNATGGPEWTNKDGWEKGTVIHTDLSKPYQDYEPGQQEKNGRLGKRTRPALPRLPLPPDTGSSSGTVNPSNCCEWYGVICAGPDGTIPNPWPPYDDDYVPKRNPPPVRRRALVQNTAQNYETDASKHSGHHASGNRDKEHHHSLDNLWSKSTNGGASATATPCHADDQLDTSDTTQGAEGQEEFDDSWQIVGL
ncbi:hypothetical protein BGZ73_005168 [Actinomortierella ambigua]|nr:hypothetical protein BGZ73_005168 [Actinomortierella ambigua]